MLATISPRREAPPLDTFHAVETPEGVALQLHPAGPVVRILAYSIDWLIRLAIFFICSIAFGGLREFGSGVLLIIYFLLEWFYPVLFEVLWGGRTPGKKWLGLWVVHDDGTPIGWQASVLRNILRAADFLPFAYMLGVIVMCLSPSFKRIGDIAAGTLVVYRPGAEPTLGVTADGTRAAPLPLTLDEQRAITAFAARATSLSAARRAELARILAPLLRVDDDQAATEIDKIANTLLGRH